MLGELFPGAKALDEGGEDSDGKLHRPRFDIDLDSGVVRLPRLAARPPAAEPVDEQPAALADEPRLADELRPADES